MKVPAFFQRSELAAAVWVLRKEFFAAVVFTVVINVLMLTPTLYMLQVFDRVMLSRSEFTLYGLTLIMLFFFSVLAFSERMRSRLLVRTGVKLDTQLNTRIFNAAFEQNLRQGGQNPAQAFTDLINLRQALTGSALFAFLDAPWSPIYILVLYLLHPWLGHLAIIFSLILFAVAYISGKMQHHPLEEASKSSMQLNMYVQNKLKNAPVVESMGMLGNLRRLWKERVQRHAVINEYAQDTAARISAFSKFVRYAQQSLALGAGALLVIQGELSPGAMIAANVLIGRATQPLDLMVSTWKQTISATEAFLRLETLLKQYPARDVSVVHQPPSGAVRLENLIASAPSRQTPILDHLNVSFPAGKIVGILGPSGSGKSTLARCLVGIWPFVEGRVLLDDERIETWERDELGPHIGYLPQDVELFEGTVAENVARFGEVVPEKVLSACQQAGVHDMILRFPQGYDTPLGEMGVHLSGGQRQRIGLARALYGDPNLIVLDEPNANLDDIGAAALQRAILDLKQKQKTVFLITHRQNIVGITDLLLILDKGCIRHFGERDAVLAALQGNNTQALPAAAPAA